MSRDLPQYTPEWDRSVQPRQTLYHAGELGVAYSIEKFRLYQRRFNATRHKGKSLLYYDHFADARRMTRRRMFLRLANPLTPLGNLSCIRHGNRTADPSLAVGNGPSLRWPNVSERYWVQRHRRRCGRRPTFRHRRRNGKGMTSIRGSR